MFPCDDPHGPGPRDDEDVYNDDDAKMMMIVVTMVGLGQYTGWVRNPMRPIIKYSWSSALH